MATHGNSGSLAVRRRRFRGTARLPEFSWRAVGLWTLTVVIAGYLATRGRAVDLGVAIACLAVVVVFARSIWMVAVCAIPALFIPAAAMPNQLLGLTPVSVVGFATAGAVLVSLLVARGLAPSWWSCMPALLLAVLGLIGGSPASDLRAEGGLALIWVSASMLGSIAGRDLRYLRALVRLCAPAAAFAIVECLGLPNYWDRITGASLYAAWPTFGGLHRAMSLFGHPVVASAVFAPLALLAFNLHVRKTVPWLAILYSAACVATLSRTGVVALAAGMLMVVAFPLEPTSRGRAAAAITTLFIAVAVIALSPLGTSLTQRFQQQDNAGRSAAISIFEHSVSTQPLSLLFGGGIGGSADYLTSIGGNTASGLADVNVFDNQLVTSIYDYGLVPCAFLFFFVIGGIATATRRVRAVATPPLVASAVAFLFFDGLFWPSAAFVLFFFVGMVSGYDPLSRRAGATQGFA